MQRSIKVALIIGSIFLFAPSAQATDPMKALLAVAQLQAQKAEDDLEKLAEKQKKAVDDAKKVRDTEGEEREEQHLKNYNAQLRQIQKLKGTLVKLEAAAKDRE